LSNSLPFTISNRFRLQREIFTGQSLAPKGVYFDTKTRTLVFAKIILNSDSGKSEIGYHRLLYKYAKQIKNSNVLIPRPIGIYKTDVGPVYLSQYFPKAKSVLETNIKSKTNHYLRVLKFLARVSKKKVSDSKSVKLNFKPGYYIVSTLPYYLLRNLISYPNRAGAFAKAYLGLIKYLPTWASLDSDFACHGDVNVTNIMSLGSKTLLLDFSQCCNSHKYYDLSQALNSSWMQPGFQSLLSSRIAKIFSLNLFDLRLLNSFVVYNLLQRLSVRYPRFKQSKFYLDRLNKLSALL